MFSTLGLFNSIPCPVDFTCDPPNCLFSHEEAQSSRAWRQIPVTGKEDTDQAVSNKRLKLSNASGANSIPIRPQSAPFVGRLVHVPSTPPGEVDEGEMAEASAQQLRQVLNEVAAPVSPPPIRRVAPDHIIHQPEFYQSRFPAPLQPLQESLNPRMISKPPATHASRLVFLKKLHEYMARLNVQIGNSKDSATMALKLDDAQLIRLALDEEEKFASEHTSVYPNMIKLRIHEISKMGLEQWKAIRMQAQIAAESRAMLPKPRADRDLSTGLSTSEEVQVLPHLFAEQTGLEQFGYVSSPLSEGEIMFAKKGIEASQNWENCERCKSRFQVFPNRAENGSLTTGGTCKYHHGRAMWPVREVGKATNTGPSVKSYTCCGEAVGVSAGCTTHETHVFKIYDGKRLASIMQFETTPENPNVPTDRAVAFDCEMAFTVHGMELIRLTATAWPNGKGLLDVLVKPVGVILDLNTRYSGVRAEDFVNALSYDSTETKKDNNSNDKCLRIVESPAAARKLLFDLLSPSTPLIGHAIENDLNVTRIVHPSIIDTVLLFPARGGLPNRRALRVLTEEMLWRKIQVAGSDGHDSKEDANAAMDLVRLTLGRKWRKMQGEGWKFVDGKLIGPDEVQGTMSTKVTSVQHSVPKPSAPIPQTTSLTTPRSSLKRPRDDPEDIETEGIIDVLKC